MVKGKKTDLEAVVKKAKIDRLADEKKEAENAKPLKGSIPPLKEYSVERVVRPKNKRKESKGEPRNVKQKSPKKGSGKTDPRTIKKVEEKPKAGEKGGLAIPDRTRRKRGFFHWFTDGGKPERED